MKDDLVLSRYVAVSDPLRDRGSGGFQRVLFSTRTARPFLASESLWGALTKGQLSSIPDTLRAALRTHGILVDRHSDELAEVVAENRGAIASNSQLYHVIQPTAACQLGCGYCGQAHTSKRMSSQDQRLLIERLRTRLAPGRYSELFISWFGAEPLLGLGVMREMSPRLRSLAADYEASYAAKVVTNGLRLTSTLALELQDLHGVVEAEVTLDGPAPVHDARRATKKNQPSFREILENLVEIAECQEITLGLIVRCNVDRGNVTSVGTLIELLSEKGLAPRVTFYVSPVYSWGNDADSESLSAEEFGRWEIEWFAQLHNRGFKIGLLPPRKRLVCLSVQDHGELTDAFGQVFNCTEVSYVPSYGRPNRYSIGGLRDEGRNAPFRRFNDEILEGQHPSCGSCHMLPVCGGSCPKLWEEGKIPCPSAKSNIRERLALWYALQKESSR